MSDGIFRRTFTIKKGVLRLIYHTILLDADDTLFDFKDAEQNAFFALLREKGVDCTQSDFNAYSAYNSSLWKRFEKGEITTRNPNCFQKVAQKG